MHTDALDGPSLALNDQQLDVAMHVRSSGDAHRSILRHDEGVCEDAVTDADVETLIDRRGEASDIDVFLHEASSVTVCVAHDCS